MGKPQKIRKKNSILFTTKHHSFNGIMGTVLFVVCLGIMITSVIFSFHNRGEVDISFGYYGFFAAVLNLLGLIAGVISVRERDVHLYAPWIALAGNSIMLIAWILGVIISGIKG